MLSMSALLCAVIGGLPMVESLPFDVKALKSMNRVEVRVTEHGAGVVYRGVPLAAILAGRPELTTGMKGSRELADDVLLIRAEDGYQVAISAAAVSMDPNGERYLLAFERDGQPLPEGVGPAKVVIPADPKGMRWIRRVKGVDLVHLDALNEPKAPAPAPPR